MKKEIHDRIKQVIQTYAVNEQEQGVSVSNEPQDKYVDKLVEQLSSIVRDNHISKADVERIRTDLFKILPDNLAKSTWEQLSKVLIPYLDLLFFQKLSKSKQQAVAEEIYKNTILVDHLDPSLIADKFGLSLNDVCSCGRALYTIVCWITIQNYSESRTEEEVKRMFGFNSELSQHLISMIVTDKAELRILMMLRYMTEVKDHLKPIEELFHSILDEKDDSNI